VRQLSTNVVPPPLRAHFRRHNLTAIALAFVSLLVAVVSWGALFFVGKWMVVLAVSVGTGVDARVPENFAAWFFLLALALCFVAAFVRWLWPRAEAADRRPLWENLLDVILIVPRITFGVWGNLSAVLFLSRREMAFAWRLLEKIADEKKIAFEQVAVEIPPRRLREKIVLALQLADLVYLKKTNAGFFLAIRGGSKAVELLEPRVRIGVPERERLQ
jgi:hypothetical protein